MNLELFDDAPTPIELTPTQENSVGVRRADATLRKRRQRERERVRWERSTGCDAPLEVVTSQLRLELSQSQTEMSRPEVTPEMAMLLRAFEWLAVAGIAVSHQSVKNALEQIAQADGIHIFHAERFLESAIERGVLPKFERSKWVSIPIEMLEQLMREAS